MMIHFSSSSTCHCGNNTGPGPVLRCALEYGMRFLCGANKLPFWSDACFHVVTWQRELLLSWSLLGARLQVQGWGCNTKTRLCRAGPWTDPRHPAGVLQRWGCCCTHFSEAPLKTLSALCSKWGMHHQRTDFGGANYVKADHIYTKSSQITTIWCKIFLSCLEEEVNFGSHSPGSNEWWELVRNPYHVIKLSWVTIVNYKRK